MPQHPTRMEVVVGDITRLQVDAIVNAANTSLLGGGGVDGAIHRAAGPLLLEHNRRLRGCDTGDAKITPSFDLQARGIRHIIHTVGPVWHTDPAAETAPLGQVREDRLLASCYQRCLELAESHHVKTLAFPAISTGVYHFPKQRAAQIAVAHVRAWLADHDLPDRVLFCCFSPDDADIYRSLLTTP